MEIQTFYTERLLLKLLTPQVYTHYFTQCSDEDAKAFFQIDGTTLQKEKYRFEQGVYAEFRNIHNFQMLSRNTGEIVGNCGFYLYNKQHSRAEIGYYMVDDRFKQKGYMTETVQFVLNYGFDVLKLNRVEAFIGENNVPSLKILLKFGFEKEGLCKGHYFINDVFENSVLYGLLKDDYVSRNDS